MQNRCRGNNWFELRHGTIMYSLTYPAQTIKIFAFMDGGVLG